MRRRIADLMSIQNKIVLFVQPCNIVFSLINRYSRHPDDYISSAIMELLIRKKKQKNINKKREKGVISPPYSIKLITIHQSVN